MLSNRSPLSTNPPVSEQFFHNPPFCPNFKNEIPSLILGGVLWRHFCKYYAINVAMVPFVTFEKIPHLGLEFLLLAFPVDIEQLNP